MVKAGRPRPRWLPGMTCAAFLALQADDLSDLDAVETIVGELVANVIRHAAGPIRHPCSLGGRRRSRRRRRTAVPAFRSCVPCPTRTPPAAAG